MSRPKQDTFNEYLTTEERKRLHTAGNSISREELKSGMIFVSSNGQIKIFKEVRQQKHGRKEYLFWEGGGAGSPVQVTLTYWREITELLRDQHPELPNKLFPEWLDK